jgi:hypothetical protein
MTDETQPKDSAPRMVMTPAGPRPAAHVHRGGPDEAVRQDEHGHVHVVPTATRRSTILSDTLVPTPGGYRPQAMVHRIAPGQGLDAGGGRRRMLTVKGACVQDCGPVVLRQPRVQIRRMGRRAVDAPAGERRLAAWRPALGTGWIAFTAWTNTTGHPITFCTTTWTVPQRLSEKFPWPVKKRLFAKRYP